MVLGLIGGALGATQAATGGTGIPVGGTAGSSGARGGVADSGTNIIAINPPILNIGAIVEAKRKGGSSFVGGADVRQPAPLGTSLSSFERFPLYSSLTAMEDEKIKQENKSKLTPLLLGGAALLGLLLLARKSGR